MSQTGPRGSLFNKPRHSHNPIQPPSESDRVVILAPHQDDESLGCGGRTIQLANAGADVTIVYTSDGRLANSSLMDQEEVVRVRQDEALEACTVLGLTKEDVLFLPFQDGSLTDQVEPLSKSLVDVLHNRQPTSLYFPYERDFHPDHEATSRAARIAIQAYGKEITGYEYVVWGIYHWPWITIPKNGTQRKLVLKNSLKELFGFRIRRAFRKAVFADIRDVKDQKQKALMKHHSQVSKLVEDPGWMTLFDVAEGSWAKQFQQDYEVFRESKFYTT